jgi:hypothetical protein
MTPEDARKNLLETVIEYLRRHAEESAARLESDEQKTALESVELLQEDVVDLTQIISSYRKLVMWVGSVTSVDRDGAIRVDHAKLNCAKVQELGYFDLGGITYLASALWAAFKIGGLAPKDPILKAEKAKMEQTLRNAITAAAREAKEQRHPEWAKINEVIDRALELGSNPKQIAKMLAAKGHEIPEPRLRKRIERRRKRKAPTFPQDV